MIDFRRSSNKKKMENTISIRLTFPINNSVCQCELVNRFIPQLMKYCCQNKVNKGGMKMHDYMQICKEDEWCRHHRQRLERAAVRFK